MPCFDSEFFSYMLSSPVRCSSPLSYSVWEVSPKYSSLTPPFSHFSQVILYKTPYHLHSRPFPSLLYGQLMQFSLSHLVFPHGLFLHSLALRESPPLSTTFTLLSPVHSCNLSSSSCKIFASSTSGFPGRNSKASDWFSIWLS